MFCGVIVYLLLEMHAADNLNYVHVQCSVYQALTEPGDEGWLEICPDPERKLIKVNLLTCYIC